MNENEQKHVSGSVTRKRLLIADLKPFPLQSQVFTPCSKAEDEALREDIRRHGQQEPVQVMPADNKAGLPESTTLDGHRRGEQMLALGYTEVDVVVRHDLKDASLATVTEVFLSFNNVRRQQHPIDQARAAQCLFLVQKATSLRKLDVWQKAELRQLIGKVLGKSGRHVDRYLRLLETPLEIQTTVRDGRLAIVVGCRVAFLPEEEQKELAAKVAALPPEQSADKLVREYVDVPEIRHRRHIIDDVRELARYLEKADGNISDRLDDVPTDQAHLCKAHFERGIKLLQKLLRKAS